LCYSIEEILSRDPCKSCELSLVCIGFDTYPHEQHVCTRCGVRTLVMKCGSLRDERNLRVSSPTIKKIRVTVDQALQAPCLENASIRSATQAFCGCEDEAKHSIRNQVALL